MEKEKNNGALITLVIVLFLLVLGLSGYIIYDKKLARSNNNNDNSNANSNYENANNTINEIDGIKANNNDVTESDLNTAFDILGIAKSSNEVYKDNCLNAYI